MAVGYLVTKYEVENLSIPAGSVLMGSVYGVPVIIIMWLRECINTLISLKMDVKGAMESQEGRKQIMRCKGIMWGLSIIILRVLSYTYIHISYLMQIEKFWLAGLILITILLCWVILSVWYEKHLEVLMHRDEKKKKFVRGCICIVLVLFTLIGYDYVEKKDHEEWYRKLVESHNQEYPQN